MENLDEIIAKLLEVKGCKPGKKVKLLEQQILELCEKS